MPLRGKTLGLFGLGRIGKAMIPRAHAFGMNVIAVDPLYSQPGRSEALGISFVDFDSLLSNSDVLSLHCPLTPETRELFNASVFSRMKPGSVFINTARGGVVNELDLCEALAQGPLAGAGLDVLEPEPPRPDHPLLKLDQVVISPHISGIDTKAMADMANKAAECIVSLYKHGWPEECVINKSLHSAWAW